MVGPINSHGSWTKLLMKKKNTEDSDSLKSVSTLIGLKLDYHFSIPNGADPEQISMQLDCLQDTNAAEECNNRKTIMMQAFAADEIHW